MIGCFLQLYDIWCTEKKVIDSGWTLSDIKYGIALGLDYLSSTDPFHDIAPMIVDPG